MKKFIVKLISITIIFIVVIIILIWQTSKSYINSVHFVQIPLNELRTCPLNYLAVQGIHIVGIVAFDEKLNLCISDGYKKFFFNQQGKIEKIWFSTEHESLIAISPDGSLWTATHLVYPPSSSYDQALFASNCIRKYDSQGRLIFQFGEPEPTLWLKETKFKQYRKILNYLKRQYNHLFGRSYQFGSAQIFGLWVDHKSRLYVLTEYPSLHIFDADGKPILVFNFEPDVTFEKERRDIEGVANFVDRKGRIYACIYEPVGRSKRFRLVWKGWKQLPWEWIDEEVYRTRIDVWEWEPNMKKIRTLFVPKNGCIVGVDKWDNIYWMVFEEKTVYQVRPNGKFKKIFQPYRFYRKEMIIEWEKIFSKDPIKRKRLEIEHKRFIEGLKHSRPYPGREIKLYRDLYTYAIEHGDGPKIGHIAFVDKEGNLYITLVTTTHFRIDKIERTPLWKRWWR